MEKFLQKIILILFFLNFSLFSQEISIMEKIRMPLWAELDAYPELKEAQNTSSGQFDYTISRQCIDFYRVTHVQDKDFAGHLADHVPPLVHRPVGGFENLVQKLVHRPSPFGVWPRPSREARPLGARRGARPPSPAGSS